jgi:antitoxin component YwqK of YwqJK toxin-antitoxin module
MKNTFLFILFLANLNSAYCQNYNKLFKSIKESSFQESDKLLIELSNEKEVDLKILSLAKSIIYSDINYEKFDCLIAYENYKKYHKTETTNIKTIEKIIKKFELDILSTKTKIENQIIGIGIKNNNIDFYNYIVSLCFECNYKIVALDNLERLEFEKCISQNKENVYENFMVVYPNSQYLFEITKKRDFLIFKKSKDDYEKIKTFLKSYPNSYYFEDALKIKKSLQNNFIFKYGIDTDYYREAKYSKDTLVESWEYENNKLKRNIRYKDGYTLSDIKYDNSGKIISEENYYNGTITDYTIDNEGTPYEKKYIREKNTFNQGKLIEKIHYYRDGNIDYSEKNEGNKITRIIYYKSGNIREYEEFLPDENNWTRNGDWIQYFENGEIFAKRRYIDSKRVGEWFSYYDFANRKSNKKFTYLTFQGNYSNGQVKFYNENGIITKIENYKNGELHGKITYEDIIMGQFENGIAVGEWQVNYNHGKPWTRVFSSKNGISLQQKYEELFDSNYFTYDLLLVGNCKVYYPDGTFMINGNFTNGIVKYFGKNGKIVKIENYRNNKLDGEVIKYNSDGSVLYKEQWHEGKRDGKNTIYSPNLEFTKAEFNCKNDKVESVDFYSNNINFNSFYSFWSFIEHSRFIFFNNSENESNNQTITFNFYNNNVLEKRFFYKKDFFTNENLDVFKNGKIIYFSFENPEIIIRSGELVDGNKSGTWKYSQEDLVINFEKDIIKEFYSNGNIKSTTPLKNGLKHGIVKYYSENGKVISIENYRNGLKDCNLE